MPKKRKYCSVPQCSSHIDESTSFHYFPKNKKVLKAWVHALKIGKKVSKFMNVCCNHFVATDFRSGNRATKGRKKLKPCAIPSQNLPVASISTRKEACSGCLARGKRRVERNIKKSILYNQPNKEDDIVEQPTASCSHHRVFQAVKRKILKCTAIPSLYIPKVTRYDELVKRYLMRKANKNVSRDLSEYNVPKENTTKIVPKRIVPSFDDWDHNYAAVEPERVNKSKRGRKNIQDPLRLQAPKSAKRVKKKSQADKADQLSKRRNLKQKSKASTSRPHSHSATQGNSSHIEEVHIKEEQMDSDPNDYRLYEELRDTIKTEPANSESDSTNSDTGINIDSVFIKAEPIVDIKKECSDSSENLISVHDDIEEKEQTPMFESVFVKEEPLDDDFPS